MSTQRDLPEITPEYLETLAYEVDYVHALVENLPEQMMDATAKLRSSILQIAHREEARERELLELRRFKAEHTTPGLVKLLQALQSTNEESAFAKVMALVLLANKTRRLLTAIHPRSVICGICVTPKSDCKCIAGETKRALDMVNIAWEADRR